MGIKAAMRNKNKLLLTFLISSLILAISKVTLAQYPRPQSPNSYCTNTHEEDTRTLRVVRLDNFGIEITIPSNYRVILRNNGSVEVATPGVFKMLQCINNGGIGGRGGYYQTLIKKVPFQKNISFDQQVRNLGVSQTISSYSFNGSPAYILKDTTSYSVEMMVLTPNRENILVIGVYCDCDVEETHVIDFAQKVKFIDN
ncbi:MAG: hypothetical protein ACRCU2_11560 [Planktothrix sp.]